MGFDAMIFLTRKHFDFYPSFECAGTILCCFGERINGYYLCIRIFFAFYATIILIWSFCITTVRDKSILNWFTYVTSWSSLFNTLYFYCIITLHYKIYNYLKIQKSIYDCDNENENIANISNQIPQSTRVIATTMAMTTNVVASPKINNNNSKNSARTNNIIINTSAINRGDGSHDIEFVSLPAIGRDLDLRHLWNFTYFLCDTGITTSIFVFILYWIFIYDGRNFFSLNPLTWHSHGIMTIMIVFDWMTSCWQTTNMGAFTVFLLTINWVCLSIIFYYGHWTNEYDNGRYIYPTINWGKYPNIAIIYSCAVIIFVPLFHLIIVKCKKEILKLWLKGQNEYTKEKIFFNYRQKTTNMKFAGATTSDDSADNALVSISPRSKNINSRQRSIQIVTDNGNDDDDDDDDDIDIDGNNGL